MVLIESQLTANQVLHALHHDEPFLFLGAAFTTVALVSAAFCCLRRRWDALLISMAAFAFLYGQRLWFQADLLRLTLPGNEVFDRLRIASTYLVPVPAFSFFRAAGFLGRSSKMTWFTKAVNVVFLAMFAWTLAYGPVGFFTAINDGVVTVMLWILMARSLGKKTVDRDFKVVRVGVLCFVVLALWDNIVGSLWIPSKVEPYGFAVLLACLGYVAARRTVERDVELGEIQKELDLARRIQLSILPDRFPESADFRVAARYVPMTSVAGDLYDFLPVAEGQAGLFIADVSGHGIPAALIASMVKMAATSQRGNAGDPANLLRGMNAALCGNTQGEYVTAAYVHLDAGTREFRYAAAGHPAMLLLRDGAVSEVIENGLPLGATDQAAYLDRTLALKNGDRLLLYTDGLVEARNDAGELFGEDRLNSTLLSTVGLAVEEAAGRMIEAAEQWARVQDDDLTVLVCDFVGAG